MSELICPYNKRCGGCQLQGIPYSKQLEEKQKKVEELIGKLCETIHPIAGMYYPYHYRNKVNAAFGMDGHGHVISGIYEEKSHEIVPVDRCLIEDKKADEIIGTIRKMLPSFKIKTYDEDTGYGLLRHVMVRRGFSSGQIMVVLVTGYPTFPSKKNFTKALLEKHPEITTVIQNINERQTSMVLGTKEQVLYGKGYIEDQLLGYTFRISSRSFYQVNSKQTEVLYKKAIAAAGLTGEETVVDAYCGIGTIGMVASRHAKNVIGVELNADAVRDANENAKRNGIRNIQFVCADSGKYMTEQAAKGKTVDVVIMDPPRSGSSEEFIEALKILAPKRVVYVSCNPETLSRDLVLLKKAGYAAKEAWPVDMFGFSKHVESVVLMSRVQK